jgi:hypothetical protein
MATTVFRKIDLNRYAKAYPFLRKEPKYTYKADEPVSLESAVVSFEGGDEVTYNFKNPYSSAPVVVATSQNDSFNVFIKTVTAAYVVVGASAANSETVSIVVVSQ